MSLDEEDEKKSAFTYSNPLVHITDARDLDKIPANLSPSGLSVKDGNCCPDSIILAHQSTTTPPLFRAAVISFIRSNQTKFSADIQMAYGCSVEQYLTNMSRDGEFGEAIFIMGACVLGVYSGISPAIFNKIVVMGLASDYPLSRREACFGVNNGNELRVSSIKMEWTDNMKCKRPLADDKSSDLHLPKAVRIQQLPSPQTVLALVSAPPQLQPLVPLVVSAVPSRRICTRNKCVEGSRRKNGSIVTFNARKKSGGHYKECDQCEKRTTVKNDADPEVGNPKKTDEVKNGMACSISSCRKTLGIGYVEIDGKKYCDAKFYEKDTGIGDSASNDAIEPTWMDAEDAAQARIIVNEQISPILAYPSACIYPCFAARYCHEQESTAFLTQPGGSYESTSRGKLVSQKASHPILTKSDGLTTLGSRISKKDAILAIDFKLSNGRRLFRNYFGGGRAAKDGEHLTYGVYLTYSVGGFGDFILTVQ
ncbi:hypothetical protein HK100_003379 [Physocladia obscura]|uniref:Uncharacterized protein n=1 Tax=Physocladia obscura TaxID=109957 RepID=A0AAD5XJB5_9FUNG|nr:hypothetical protein HK100_003379 [Physocladia obscura]